MAETKTTKPKAAKPKTVKENEKINDGEEKFLKEEVIENEVEASEPEDVCNANCEAYHSGEPVEDQPVVDEPEPESAEETQNPAEEPITPENVAEKIAEVKGIPTAEVISLANANAIRLFGLDIEEQNG